MERVNTENRQLHMDLLRILACFSVIMLHVSSQFWYDLPVTSTEWIASNVYDSAFRFGVPVFVMISGRFFLAKSGEVNLHNLYGGRILRLFTAFCVWSAAYGLWDTRFWMDGVGLKQYVSEMMMGRYHLWYLPMLIGIYVLLPILKKWVEHCSKKDVEYFLMLFCVFQIGISTLKIMELPAPLLQVVYQFASVEMVCSYVGYFVLGYYLYHYPISAKMQRVIYAGGIVGLVGAIVVSTLDALVKFTPVSTAFDSFSVFTFGVTVAVYVFFQEVAGKWKLQKGTKLIREISANTFGVYLMHLLVLEFLSDKNIHSMSINNILGIPALALGIFVICTVLTAVLRRIPFVGKYIC